MGSIEIQAKLSANDSSFFIFHSQIGDVFSGLQENGLLDSYSHLLTGYIGNESFLREVGAIVKAIRAINPHIVYGTSAFQIRIECDPKDPQ